MAAGICLIKISILILLEKLPLLIILFCQARDLSIAYFLVALTYIVVGLLFFISFPKEKSCIQEVKCIVGSNERDKPWKFFLWTALKSRQKVSYISFYLVVVGVETLDDVDTDDDVDTELEVDALIDKNKNTNELDTIS